MDTLDPGVWRLSSFFHDFLFIIFDGAAALRPPRSLGLTFSTPSLKIFGGIPNLLQERNPRRNTGGAGWPGNLRKGIRDWNV